LRHLEEMGLTPQTAIEVTAYSPFDHNLTVKTGRKLHVLGIAITSKIFVAEA